VAPTFIWGVFWLGLVPVAVIFGDVWRILSPWKALADLVAFLSRSRSLHWRVFEYPERAGIWPAAVLLLCVLAVALAYLTAIGVARLLVSADRPLAPLFVYSLVPIALAYAIAHYFSLAYYQGQWAVRLASDPLGRGWDLFGSADYAAQAHTLSPNTIWYVQVAALVCGHVIALALAHDRAVATFQTVYGAILAQFSLLALMVLYTVGGLWILSQG
jgi:hypothetical protein